MNLHDRSSDSRGTVRVTPYGLIVSVLLTIISAVSGGAWFMSAQSYTITSQANAIAQLNAQQQDMRREIDARRVAVDTDTRAQDRTLSTFDIRLTRIEAQLVYLLAAQTDAGRKLNAQGGSK
jgi:hypothetical protein